MERVELRTNTRFKLMMFVLGLMSFGFLPFVLWLAATRHYPRALDLDGVTLRSGERVAWASLTGKHVTRVQFGGGQPIVTVVDLKFAQRKAKIALMHLADRRLVLPILSRVLREDLAAA